VIVPFTQDKINEITVRIILSLVAVEKNYFLPKAKNGLTSHHKQTEKPFKTE
jgi:hypothetical protein